MKNTYLILPLMMLIGGCSGIAPEAVREESNTLTKPSFMKTKAIDDVEQKDVQPDTKTEV
jgi:hypothetical protein